MSVQKMSDTPRTGTRRRWVIIVVGVGVVMCLCIVGIAVAGLITWQRVVESEDSNPLQEALGAVLDEEGESTAALNRISFIDEVGQIGTVAPDGSDQQQLTAEGERVYLFPAWSPDGSRLAAIGSDRDGGGVFVVNDHPAGPDNEPQELYFSEDENPFYLYWSPDSSQISFLANHPEGIGLHLVDTVGSAESRLLDTGQPFYWQWAAAGNQLLYHTGFNREDARLAILDVASGDSGENLARPGFFQAPGISPTGDYFAFAEIDAADARWLVVQNRAGEEQQRVPHFGSAALSWSPTANQVAFISPELPDNFNTGFFGTLRLLDVASGDVTVLSGEFVLAFFWSPDGQQIAYVTVAEPGEDVTAEKEAFRARPAAQQEDPLRFQLWVADVASGQSRRLLTFQPTILYVTQFIPFFDQYALSHRVWSPDSQALVLPVQETEADVIYVVSTVDGTTQAVAEGVIGFWSPR